jgi:hypothetical protein
VQISVTFFTVGYADPERDQHPACSTTVGLGDIPPDEVGLFKAMCTSDVGCPASYTFYFVNVSGEAGGGP